MAISLKHLFQSAKTDGPDNTIVQPSDWNDEHVLTLDEGKIVGRAAGAGTGAAQELPMSVATDGSTIISGSSSNAMLRITQTGAGNALVVEDSANPDATPFVVAADGNVGIGTSSPANNAGYGTLTINGTSGGVLQLQEAGTNRFQIFANSTAAYLNGQTSQPMVFITNATEKMRIDASGNVGIGTSSPSQKLDVAGQVRVAANAGTITHALNYNENGGEIVLYDEAGTAATLLDQSSNQTRLLELINGSNLVLGMGGGNSTGVTQFMGAGYAEAMRIDASGNVGIGTTSITQRLTVSGNGLFTGNVDATNITGTGYSFRARANAGDTQGGLIQFTNNAATDQWAGITSPSSNQLVFYNGGGTELGRFNNTSFCVGTTSADGRVSVTSAGSTAAWQVRVNSSGVGNDSGIYMDASNHMMLVARNGSGGETIAMRSAGTSWVNGGKFLINATSSFDGVSDARQQIYTTGSACLACKVDGSGPGTFVSFFDNSGGRIGWIGFGGATTSYNTTSDYRLKDNVEPLSGSLEKIMALHPVSYEWKQSQAKGEGFLAHEVQEHIPLAVSGEKDAVMPSGEINAQGVDYSKIVVHLVAAIQEQQRQIDELKRKLS